MVAPSDKGDRNPAGGNRVSDARPDPVEVRLEEYRTLRQEVLTSMATQQSILSFGTAAVGVLIAGSFNVWDEPVPAAVLFFVFVPLLSYLVLMLWVNEVIRMLRAGYFVGTIEICINELMGDDSLLTWERTVHRAGAGETGRKSPVKTGDVERLSFIVVCSLFVLIAAAGIAIGYYHATELDRHEAVVNVGLAVSVLVLLAFVAAAAWVYGKRRRFLEKARRREEGEEPAGR